MRRSDAETVAVKLRRRGYLPVLVWPEGAAPWAADKTSEPGAGLVAFLDRRALSVGWNGRRAFGQVRLSGYGVLRNALAPAQRECRLESLVDSAVAELAAALLPGTDSDGKLGP